MLTPEEQVIANLDDRLERVEQFIIAFGENVRSLHERGFGPVAAQLEIMARNIKKEVEGGQGQRS